MESKETQTVGLRVTTEELATLDTKAAEAGISRPDYIRGRLFAPDRPDGPDRPDQSAKIAELEKQLNLLTDQLSRAAEAQESRKCSNPEHAKIWGAGHCFDCDLPIVVPTRQ
jgi:hypothetical protein